MKHRELMKYSDTIIQELKDCKAGEQLRLSFTPQASVAIMSEAEYLRWKAEKRTKYFLSLTPNEETDSTACYTIPADGNYILRIESHDDCPHAELKSMERTSVDTFVFNGKNETKKIVRKIPEEGIPICSMPVWERKSGIALRDPWLCFSCESLQPSSSLHCIPVKIASMLEKDYYSVPVCPKCLQKMDGHAFMVPTMMLVKMGTVAKSTYARPRKSTNKYALKI